MTLRCRDSNVTVNVLRVIAFGGLGIASDDGPAAPRLRPPRLALLAVLAAAGDRGVSRERLAALFWPEADEEHALHSLRQARYALRNDLGCEVIRSIGSTLALDSAAISADVAEFRAALAAGDRARAVAFVLGGGPYLDGFYLPGASAFERWVEEERARIVAATTSALLSLAAEATQSDELDVAVDRWRQLTDIDPLSGRFALGYLKALAARGDRAAALAFARQHETVVRRELEADPDPDVRRLEAELRAMPSPPLERPPQSAALPIGMSVAVDEAPVGDASAVRGGAGHRSRAARRSAPRRALIVAAAAVLTFVMTAAVVRQSGWLSRADSRPVLAVGFIREDGVPEPQRMGPVLTDMLATSLAQVQGLPVLANSRLLELMRPGQDAGAGFAKAARRAGATELLEGRLIATEGQPLSLEMRHVELRTGLVREVYRVAARDRYALVDSMTQAVARRFRLVSPASSIAQATSPSPTAYRLYEQGLRAYFSGDYRGAQRLLHAATEEDSAFAMAAYYEVVNAKELEDTLPDGRHLTEARRATLRLAQHAPERERLTITAGLLVDEGEPLALAVAESLTTRYPDDPRALNALARARWLYGDWSGAASALERAIALDSIGEPRGRPTCQLCQDYALLADVYLWADSLAAVDRTMRRYLEARRDSHPWYVLALNAARLGDSASAHQAYQRMYVESGGDKPHVNLRLDLLLDDYDAVERDAQPLLASSWAYEWGVGADAYLIALRNEGRLREAVQFHLTGTLPGLPKPAVSRSPNDFDEGILAFERGKPRAAATVFATKARENVSQWSPAYQARVRTWNSTLQGMALAAAGDTAGIRPLIDSIVRWGSRSAYGRDRRAHHYLRGLMHVAARHDEDAVREFRLAMHSPNLGFTRVNYELARALLRLGRPSEAVAALQSSLRGDVDASNLYITRTELHELLAQAFDAAGRSDSAAVHYRTVLKAWKRADPEFHARRQLASAWLDRHALQASR
ncbi:MAG TPA: BTAD domain-containing putative transcriptional regulator [Gemmatimonadaceae bacterium]|nr:BTAD domain-containing putative transcriptional regulator [Gemmatimonadaceae bacterium]